MARYTNLRAVVIPRVAGLRYARVEQRINRTITQRIRGLLLSQGYGRPGVSVWTEQQITLNDQGVLSLWYDVYAYPERAAHGLTVRTSFNFSLLTGRLYRLSDLFLPTSDYIARLSAIIKQQIEQQGIPLIKEFQQISPNESFFMTREELVIYFQTYQYTPYYVGIPEFRIPYTEIAGLLSPQGPAYRFLPGQPANNQ